MLTWRAPAFGILGGIKLNQCILQGPQLALVAVGEEAAEDLLPAYNGDEQFTMWSGGDSTISLATAQREIAETLKMPGGNVWRIQNQAADLTGMAITALVPPPDNAWIALLMIRKEYQRHGLGSESAQLLEDWFFSQPNIRHIGLGVLTVNTPAVAFWSGRGYRSGLRRKDLYGNETITFRLDKPSAL